MPTRSRCKAGATRPNGNTRHLGRRRLRQFLNGALTQIASSRSHRWRRRHHHSRQRQQRRDRRRRRRYDHSRLALSRHVIGDDGEADYTAGVLTTIISTDDLYGGDDTIAGPFDVNTNNRRRAAPAATLLGGFGADPINVGGAEQHDPRRQRLRRLLTRQRARYEHHDVHRARRRSSVGGNDVINVSSGGNVIIGGTGADTITIGGSGNVVLGDDGDATSRSSAGNTPTYVSVLTAHRDDRPDRSAATTASPSMATATTSSSAVPAPTRFVNGSGNNVIFGDNGDATFHHGHSRGATKSNGPAAATRRDLTEVEKSAQQRHCLRRRRHDHRRRRQQRHRRRFWRRHDYTGNGSDVVLGDSGFAIFDPTTATSSDRFSPTFGGALAQRLQSRTTAHRATTSSRSATATTSSSAAPATTDHRRRDRRQCHHRRRWRGRLHQRRPDHDLLDRRHHRHRRQRHDQRPID